MHSSKISTSSLRHFRTTNNARELRKTFDDKHRLGSGRHTKVSSSPQVPFRAMLLRYLSHCSSRKGANSSGWALILMGRVSTIVELKLHHMRQTCKHQKFQEHYSIDASMLVDSCLPTLTVCESVCERWGGGIEKKGLTSCTQWQFSSQLCDSLECRTAQMRWHETAAASHELGWQLHSFAN